MVELHNFLESTYVTRALSLNVGRYTLRVGFTAYDHLVNVLACPVTTIKTKRSHFNQPFNVWQLNVDVFAIALGRRVWW